MIQFMQSFSTFEFVQGITALVDLPDRLPRREFEAALGDKLDQARAVLFALESIGILVHKREVPIGLAEDFFAGPAMLSWRKSARYVHELREANGIRTHFEYYEWLVNIILERRESVPREPAYIAHRDWKPK
jgi:hypothetical protein